MIFKMYTKIILKIAQKYVFLPEARSANSSKIYTPFTFLVYKGHTQNKNIGSYVQKKRGYGDIAHISAFEAGIKRGYSGDKLSTAKDAIKHCATGATGRKKTSGNMCPATKSRKNTKAATPQPHMYIPP